MENTARNRVIDFYKGILMWGVIWGHFITACFAGWCDKPVGIHTFFRIYDMPFFMLISGYLLQGSINRYSLKQLLMNKVTYLLVPLAVWNILLWDWKNFYFLGAVFASSVICIGVHAMAKRWGRWTELLLYGLVIVLLHIVRSPWNVSYLFPFFCVGFFLSDLDFKLRKPYLLLVIAGFIAGVVFWKPAYSGWALRYDAWQTDIRAIGIYIYRFVLGVLGCVTMAQVFQWFYRVLPAKWVRYLSSAGSETLGLYLLQGVIVEFAMKKLVLHADMSFFDAHLAIVHPVVGYMVAPVFAALLIGILLVAVRWMKASKYTRWLLGFKLKSLTNH